MCYWLSLYSGTGPCTVALAVIVLWYSSLHCGTGPCTVILVLALWWPTFPVLLRCPSFVLWRCTMAFLTLLQVLLPQMWHWLSQSRGAVCCSTRLWNQMSPTQHHQIRQPATPPPVLAFCWLKFKPLFKVFDKSKHWELKQHKKRSLVAWREDRVKQADPPLKPGSEEPNHLLPATYH